MSYKFAFPTDTPDLTFDGLTAYINGIRIGTKRRPYTDMAWIGTTVRLDGPHHDDGLRFHFHIHGLLIARIFAGHIGFPKHGDTHANTREWVSKIVADNGLGGNAWRRPKADVLCINGDPAQPLEGHTFKTDGK